MQSTYRAKVMAVTASQGEFKDDEGNIIAFDSTKVWIELPLSGKKARGVASKSYKVGKADLYDRLGLETVALPFIADITTIKTTNGRDEEREEVIRFEIVKTPEAKAA